MPEHDGGVLTAPDNEMLGLARQGDLAAREELFRRQFGVAYRVARRLLGNEQDALDAVQDGFLKALVHLQDFDGRSGFRTWLLRIVTNAALDLGRKRRRRATISLDDGGESSPRMELCGDAEDPGLGLYREDLRRLVDGALERLSPSTRSTFVLFAEAELSYKEIAECQQVPIGTVMSRLHYARQKLQGYLEGAAQPGMA